MVLLLVVVPIATLIEIRSACCGRWVHRGDVEFFPEVAFRFIINWTSAKANSVCLFAAQHWCLNLNHSYHAIAILLRVGRCPRDGDLSSLKVIDFEHLVGCGWFRPIQWMVYNGLACDFLRWNELLDDNLIIKLLIRCACLIFRLCL